MTFVIVELIYRAGHEEPDEREIPGCYDTHGDCGRTAKAVAEAIGPPTYNHEDKYWWVRAADGTKHVFFCSLQARAD